ncbi:MAG: acyltransferase [Chloroflexi bacterium]|nr:acyltransferase [Chloroflexota bacterium]
MHSDSSPRIMVGQHYPELDGIRGIAILLVLVFHCRIIFMPQSPLEQTYFAFAESMWVGVDLFFVLSGFLITGILLDTYPQKDYFRSFYIRRILRIFPLYYSALLLVTIMSHVSQVETLQQSSVIAQTSYWLYLQNWLTLFDLRPTSILGHFWSLAIEEQFYLVWPAFVLFAAKRNAVAKLCISAIVLAFIVRAILVSQIGQTVGGTQPAYFVTFSRIDALALGSFAAWLFHKRHSLESFRPAASWLAAISGIIIAVVVVTQKGFNGHNSIVLYFGLLPLAVFFSSLLMLALTTNTQNPSRIFLRGSWLRFIGKISYGVYIFHWPAIVLLKQNWLSMTPSNFWINQFGFIVMAAIASITIAWLSYQYFESPFLRLKDKLAPIK